MTEPGGIGDFLRLLRDGVGVAVRVGCTVEDLLLRQFRIDEAYVARRVTTIFLDGKPVDAIASVRIRDGSTLALSAAMPGLAGATLRRGGPLSSLREGITHAAGRGGDPEKDGVITVKLFNLLARELGPVFLRRGVLLPAADAEAFFRGTAGTFRGEARAVFLDGERIRADTLERGGWAAGAVAVALTVEAEEGPCGSR